MTLEEYTLAVLDRLPVIPGAFDLEATKRQIAQCYEDEWPITGAVSYCECLEHVNPDLSEDYALKRMSELGARYRKPGSKGYIIKNALDSCFKK